MKLTDGSDAYIIRIYRYMNDESRTIVGTAERIGARRKRAFTGIDELWEILNSGAEQRLVRSGKEKTTA